MPELKMKAQKKHKNKVTTLHPEEIKDGTEIAETESPVEQQKAKKRKNKQKINASDPKSTKLSVNTANVELSNAVEEDLSTVKHKQGKKKNKIKLSDPVLEVKDGDLKYVKESKVIEVQINEPSLKKNAASKNKSESLSQEEIYDKYPVLKNTELIQKFMNVSMNNNQKGRIRQVLRDVMRGASTTLLPDVIHNRIQSILTSTKNLSDTDLRKIRILYNMLKTATVAKPSDAEVSTKPKKTKKKSVASKAKDTEMVEDAKETEDGDVKKEVKVKGPKRYVVFVGNLAPDVNKEKIMQHFTDIKDFIKDVRIPVQKEGKNSAIAYLELANESTFEMALSKHHSMLDNRRINVLYTTQKNTKISKADAKVKTAKLQAMLRSGQLVGSVALVNKRSQRRAKLRLARRAEAAATA